MKISEIDISIRVEKPNGEWDSRHLNQNPVWDRPIDVEKAREFIKRIAHEIAVEQLEEDDTHDCHAFGTSEGHCDHPSHGHENNA